MGTSPQDRARSGVQSLAHAAQLRWVNNGSKVILVGSDRRFWKPNMPRTARDTSENIDRGFSLRAFTRAGAAVAKTYVKYVVLVLVVGQLALATACTQPSGVRYISTQEPALGSER